MRFYAEILSVSLNVFWEIFFMELLLGTFLSDVKFDKAFDFLYIFKSVVTKWYLYLALALVIIGVVLFACLIKQPKRNNLSKTQSLAYVAMLSALSVAVNVLQIPTPLAQLSLVATVCCIAGVLLGPVNGFAVALIGDLIAGIVAPMGIYSPIIGIGTSLFGLVPGVIFAFFKGKDWIKAIIAFAITFVLTSFILNTIGLCLIYPKYYV
jgi:ECF transporter S component (folate family)